MRARMLPGTMSTGFATASRDGLGPEQLRWLASAATEAAASDGLPTLVTRLVPVLSRLVEFDQLALAMAGADGRHWVLVCGRRSQEEPGWLELGDGPSPLRDCLETGIDALVSRPGSQITSPADESSALPDFASFPSALCLPLRGVAESLGALGVFSARGGAYGPDQLHVLRIVAAFVESAARRLVQSEQVARLEGELSHIERLGAATVRFVAADVRASFEAMAGRLNTVFALALPAEARRAVDELRDDSQRLRSLLALIEDTGRFEDGELVARPTPVPLSPFLRELLDVRRTRAARARVHLSGRAEPERVIGLFDAELVGRALQVLLDNSLAWTPSGGRIGLVARLSRQSLTLAVGDSGPRVPESERDRLLSRYGRLVGEGEPPRMSGTLGLYFCKLVADAHRGSFTVEDLPGAGPLFKLVLPR